VEEEAPVPFADGNGRTGRALALWEFYRRGFDTHHIFSVDEYYRGDRPRYYAGLAAVQARDEELTAWLGYCAEGLQQTLERVWQRIQHFSAAASGARLVLRPKQGQLLQLLRARGKPESARDLGRHLHLQAGRDGSDAAAREGEAPQARRHAQERSLCAAMSRYVICSPWAPCVYCYGVFFLL
jgi:hypothetical protein